MSIYTTQAMRIQPNPGVTVCSPVGFTVLQSGIFEVADASKTAFITLVRQLERWGFTLIDCQVHTDHLASLGAAPVSRKEFTALLERGCQQPDRRQPWMFDEHPGLTGSRGDQKS